MSDERYGAENCPAAFIIEPATADDLNYVRSSWLRSFADSHLARHAGPSYWPGHKEVRDRLMEECPPIVARLSDVPTSICGWACFGPDIVHYVFVRERWQKNGIAKLLLEPLTLAPRVIYTHKTKALAGIRLPDSWIYNPYMALVAPKVA